jgi:hypothetical protein
MVLVSGMKFIFKCDIRRNVRSWDSPVGIAVGYSLDDGGVGV